MGDNVDYGSIQSLWPISASTAEGKLTLIPLSFFFFSIAISYGACISLISSLPLWYVPGEACNQSWLLSLLILWYLPRDDSHWHLCVLPEASQLLWTLLRRSIEYRSKDPLSRKPAQRNVPTSAPYHLRDSSSICPYDFRSCLIFSKRCTFLQNGLPHRKRDLGAAMFPACSRCGGARNPRPAPKEPTPYNSMLTLGWCRLQISIYACAKPHLRAKPQTPRRGGARGGDRKRLRFSAAVLIVGVRMISMLSARGWSRWCGPREGEC